MNKRALRVIVAIGIALIAFGALGNSRAVAHAGVEETSPAQGAVVPHSPTTLSVSFTEAVVIARAPKLTDAKGKVVATGAARMESSGRKLVLPVDKLAHGTYVLDWRVESGDGHPIRGAFSFSVGMPTMGVSVDQLTSGDSGDASIGAIYAVLRALSFAFVIIAIGGIYFLIAISRGAAGSEGGQRITRIATIGLAATSAVTLFVIGPYLRGGTLGDVFSAERIGDVFDNDLGKAIGARLVIALLGLVVISAALRIAEQKRNVALVLGGVWSVLAISTYTFAGHPRTGRWQSLAVVLDVLHLSAASVWIGGLVLLLAVTLRRPLGDVEVGEAQSLRFSWAATVSVAIVAVTGTVQGFRQLAALSEIWDTTYGRFLVLKILGVAAILAIGATSRQLVHRDLEGEVQHLHRLRKKVVLETVIAVVVVGLTAGLVNAGPPRELAVSKRVEAKPVTTMGTTDTMHFQVTMTPGRVGMNVLTIDAMNLKNVPVPLLEMNVVLSPTTGDHPPVTIPIALRDGVYHADGVFIPYGGVWKVHVVAVTGPVDQVETDIEITIP